MDSANSKKLQTALCAGHQDHQHEAQLSTIGHGMKDLTERQKEFQPSFKHNPLAFVSDKAKVAFIVSLDRFWEDGATTRIRGADAAGVDQDLLEGEIASSTGGLLLLLWTAGPSTCHLSRKRSSSPAARRECW